MAYKIAFFGAKPYDIASFDKINERYEFDIRYYKGHLNINNVVLTQGVDAVCIFVNDTADAAVIDALVANGVKLLALRCAGFNNVDLNAARGKLPVVRVPAYSPYAVAEYTLALMLSLNRKIHRAYWRTRDGNFSLNGLMGFDMHGKTAGIIGTGKIAKILIHILKGLGMRVLANDLYPDEKFAKEEGITYVSLDELYKESDIISLHCPLTDQTRYLINDDSIAKMKDGVRVINVSRGAVLDIYALAEALKSGHVAGAAIDVFPTEPLTKDINPFLGMDNVVITPHLGASTVEAQIGVSVDVAEGVMEALKGEPVATAVNMAPVPPNVYNVIHPYFDLMERMGNLAVYLADAPMKEIEVEYTGELADTETRLLTTAVLKGALNPILQESVNYVNAAEVAKTRHIAIKEINSQSNGYFVNSVTVRVRTNKGEHAIVGVLFNGTEAKIVQIDEYRVDFTPEGYLLLVPHVDQPNMIGQISTILGQAHINIMGMQVGRMTKSGNNIMAIAVQDDIPNDIMVKLRSINGILDMKLIHCDIH